jgi:hypothetical protein
VNLSKIFLVGQGRLKLKDGVISKANFAPTFFILILVHVLTSKRNPAEP